MNCHGWTPALDAGGARVRLSVTQKAGELWQPGPSGERKCIHDVERPERGAGITQWGNCERVSCA